MAKLSEMVGWMDAQLRTAEIGDYPHALNGLQLGDEAEISQIYAAVDASFPVIQKAATRGPGLLLVHHGLFWQGLQPIRGVQYRKIKHAMDAGVAIYSSHLPLDVHPEFGNNFLLAQALGVYQLEPVIESHGQKVGLIGNWRGTRAELLERASSAVGSHVHHCPGGPDEIRRVAIITGGAGGEVAKIAALGADAFVTGEGPHWSYPLAEELGLNVFYAGHYATETFGVKILAGILAAHFACKCDFIDHPTGL